MALDFNMPVLVVDDYWTMVRIVRNFLKQLGFCDVDVTQDGHSALEMMHDKRYGLIISDWHMAPLTGYDLLREVRADRRFARTPFIMVSGEMNSENIAAARKAGLDSYLAKPFNAVTLQSKILPLFTGGPQERFQERVH
ncbi:MAG: response regulator [Pseudomonadota bacterium]